MSSRPDTRSHVKLVGRTTLNWPEAIERALEESAYPLDAYELAQVIMRGNWVKYSPLLAPEAVMNALGRILAKGNKMGLLIAESGGRRRKYWLGRKGPVPQSTDGVISDAKATRTQSVRLGAQLDQTMAHSRDLIERAQKIVDEIKSPSTTVRKCKAPQK